MIVRASCKVMLPRLQGTRHCGLRTAEPAENEVADDPPGRSHCGFRAARNFRGPLPPLWRRIAERLYRTKRLSAFSPSKIAFRSVFQGPAAAALLNLLIATIHTGVLGALLTFSGSALYPACAHASIGWSVAPLVDQQLGGLIMWIPGGLSNLAAGMWSASRSLVPARA
ncbi:MAG TPA: cytochrome c oxidase assembly protein [Bryobacteraceae bacterium]|nr:cytochrome c oxidase assembly protein [Bryobacteraceae bacterium]